MANNEKNKTNVIDKYNEVKKAEEVKKDFEKNGRIHIGELNESAYQLRMTIMAEQGKELIVPTFGSFNGQEIKDGLIIPVKSYKKEPNEKTK